MFRRQWDESTDDGLEHGRYEEPLPPFLTRSSERSAVMREGGSARGTYSQRQTGFSATSASDERESILPSQAPSSSLHYLFRTPRRPTFEQTTEPRVLGTSYEAGQRFQFSIQVGPMSLFTMVSGLVVLGTILFLGGFLTALLFVDHEVPGAPGTQASGVTVHHAHEQPAHRVQPEPLATDARTHQPPLLPVEVAHPRPAKLPLSPSPVPAALPHAVEHADQPAKEADALKKPHEGEAPHPSAAAKLSRLWDKRPTLKLAADLEAVDEERLHLPYVVQLGGFSQTESARIVAQALRSRGHHAYVVTQNDPKHRRISYSVRVGGYATPVEALRIAHQIRQTEKLSVVAIAKVAAENVVM